MNKYEDLIYYTICESIYDEQKSSKEVQYTGTFRNLCRGIAINIEHDIKLTHIQNKIINYTIQNLLLIYGENTENISRLLLIFFKEKKWELYQKTVILLRDNLIFEYQI